MLAIRLPEDLESRLDKLANKTGRTKTYYAREAIFPFGGYSGAVWILYKKM